MATVPAQPVSSDIAPATRFCTVAKSNEPVPACSVTTRASAAAS